MTSTTTATPTTQSVRVATVRVHSLSALIAHGVWTLPEAKRDAINAIRIPVEPGTSDDEVAAAIEDRVGAILTPDRHRHGHAVSVRPFTLDNMMQRPATSVAEVGPADAVNGHILFGEREIGFVRVIPDPDSEQDPSLTAFADRVTAWGRA